MAIANLSRRWARIVACVGAVLAWSALPSQVWAQSRTDITPKSAAQSLSCLKRPKAALEFPKQNVYDRAHGFARVKLVFKGADTEPELEWLANTLREDMKKLVQEHVADYRLPCWQPADGTVRAVQEFSFSNDEARPLPLPPEADVSKSCYVQSDEELEFSELAHGREVSNVVVTMTYAGDGKQAPVVKIVHEESDGWAAETLAKWAGKSRMRCREAGDPPSVMRLVYKIYPYGTPRAAFGKKTVDLLQFLRMSEAPGKLLGSFDFNTMS